MPVKAAFECAGSDRQRRREALSHKRRHRECVLALVNLRDARV